MKKEGVRVGNLKRLSYAENKNFWLSFENGFPSFLGRFPRSRFYKDFTILDRSRQQMSNANRLVVEIGQWHFGPYPAERAIELADTVNAQAGTRVAYPVELWNLEEDQTAARYALLSVGVESQ